MFDGHGHVEEGREEVTASTDEAREELRNRYPDVIRIAAGLAAADGAYSTWRDMAMDALDIVIACEEACGIGGDA